jgi:vacuolar-type H+-ATPase subunit F/Vma7
MRALAIGDERRLAGYTLAGADVLPAATATAVEAAWADVGDDVGLLVLTPEAFALLERRLADRAELVWAVLPA